MIKFLKSQKGFGMLEVVIGVGIIAASLFGLIYVSQMSIRLSEETSYNSKASFLLEEGVEAVKIMRDTSWANIAGLNAGSEYYLNFNGTTWATTTNNVFIDGIFERKIILENVNRDAGDRITASGGSADSGTKKLTIYVSWFFRNATTTRSVTTYITNLF